MDITEKWLGEIGGWAAMKAARSLVQAGAVADAAREGDLVQGTVGAGKTKYRAGLKIAGKSDVRNLCTCPASRGRGVICEHSLAVVLAVIAPEAAAAKPAAVAAGAPREVRPASAGSHPAAMASGRFEVFLPVSLFEAGGSASGARPPARHSVFLRHVPQAAELPPESAIGAAHGRLARWLAEQGIPVATTPLALDSAGVTGLLAALGDHPAVFLGRPGKTEPTPLAIMAEPTRLPVIFEELPDQQGALAACGKRSEQIAGLAIGPPGAGQGAWFFCRKTATVFQTPPVASAPYATLIRELAEAPVSGPRTAAWLVEHREALDAVLQITLEGPALSRLHVLPIPCEIELSLDGSLQAVVARLEARFGHLRWPLVSDRQWSHASGVRFPIQNELERGVFYTKNELLEIRAIEELEVLGFAPQGHSEWVLTGRAAVLRFYGSYLPRLRRTLHVQEGDRWRASTRQLRRVSPKIELDRVPPGGEADRRQSRDWLAFEIAYEAPDGFRLPRADVLRMIRSGNRSARGPGGLEYVLDEEGCDDLEESLRDIQVEMTATGGKSSADHLQCLENWCDHHPSVKTSIDSLISTERLRFLLSDIAPLLRPYQEAGIRWLEARLRSGGGALLADDMGLGKTLQAIACLRLLRSQSAGGPALILCPKTLLENWRSEMERFSPGIRVVVWAGSGRLGQRKALDACDVILSSYSLAHRDLEILRELSLSALILDEASFIRNPDTDAARAVFQLRPARRLALTGTPIENSVADLWSIMQFLAPGYLGPRKAFRERFEKPLLEAASTNARVAATHPAERLRRLIRPFFLRRTKQEVLPELPEKIEEIQWCELSRPQMEVYRRLLEEGREEVRQAARRASAGSARLTMFTVLLRLRQVCCDLRLAGLPDQVIRGLEPEEISGKMASLTELLQLRGYGDGKILIFSQFTKFLFQIRESLRGLGIGYSYLDGSSEDRAEQVRAFKSEPSRRVFLISLKAGGYGLNLAEADQVILMDPWWNPAVEAQAIDRAHRFGQERVVTATRMIARGTVEEKILKLQQAKRGLVGSVVESAGGDTGGLTADEMEGLLG